MQEAASALTMLGFQNAAAQRAVAAIVKEQPGLAVEEIIRLALKQMAAK